MPFNIEAFKQNISDYGYLDNSNFEAIVSTPPVLFNSVLNNAGIPTDATRIAKNLKLRIDQVRVPGISIQSTQNSRYGIGPIQNMPINAQFQEMSFSILVDEFGEIWQYWYNWLRTIFEFSSLDAGRTGVISQLPSYTAEYKDNYSSTIQIINYDHFGNAVQKINFYEVFPTAIREVPLSWGDAQLMKLNISLSYSDYVIVNSSLEKKVEKPKGPSASERNTVFIRP